MPAVSLFITSSPPRRHCEHRSSRWESHNDLCVQFLPCLLWSTEGTTDLTSDLLLTASCPAWPHPLSTDAAHVGTQTRTSRFWNESAEKTCCLNLKLDVWKLDFLLFKKVFQLQLRKCYDLNYNGSKCQVNKNDNQSAQSALHWQEATGRLKGHFEADADI